MMYQLKALKLFVCIITLSLENVNCNDNAIQSKLRFKRYNKQQYVGMWYNMKHPPPLPINGSYHKNKVTLPEKAIYCTITPKRNADRFSFLLKYYSSISGKPVSYTNTIECIYPRSVEFPELGDKAPEPTLTAFERYEKAMWQYIANLHERSAKARRGEKTEPLGRFNAEYYANEMVKETFNDKPDPKDIVDDSSPNGIICERIKFIEPYTENLEIIRPICYPAPRPPRPPPPPTTPRPTITSALSDIYETACYVLCHTGAIYQLLSCCRKSVEFSKLGDEMFQKALMQYTASFRERLDKVTKRVKTELMVPFGAEYYADKTESDVFYHKPDPNYIVDDSSTNGIICKRINFIELYIQNLEIIRPILFPTPRAPSRPPHPTRPLPPTPPPLTTSRPTTTTAASDIYDKACYVL